MAWDPNEVDRQFFGDGAAGGGRPPVDFDAVDRAFFGETQATTQPDEPPWYRKLLGRDAQSNLTQGLIGQEAQKLGNWGLSLYGAQRALKGGFSDMLSSLGATSAVWQGDPEAAQRLGAQQGDKTPQQQAFARDLEAAKQTRGDETFAQAAANLGEAIWNNPAGAFHTGVAQTANMLPPMGGMVAGAQLGALAFPPMPLLGAVVGGAVGGVLGAIGVETGGYVKEDVAKGQELTQEELDRIKGTGAIKGAVVGGVDLLTLGFIRWMFGIPGRLAQRAALGALSESGVNVADKAAVELALSTPALREAAASAASRALQPYASGWRGIGLGAAGLGAEMAGEAAGEYGGEAAAGNKPSPTEALLEGVMTLGQSGSEVLWAREHARQAREAFQAQVGLRPEAAAAFEAADQALGAGEPPAGVKWGDPFAQADVALGIGGGVGGAPAQAAAPPQGVYSNYGGMGDAQQVGQAGEIHGDVRSGAGTLGVQGTMPADRGGAGIPAGGPGAQTAQGRSGPIALWAAPEAAQPYLGMIRSAADRYGVPADLLAAVAEHESGWNPAAVSKAGAQGLMQFMPGTAERFGVQDPTNPEQAIPAAARYLSTLHDEFGDWDLALAGYNAGEGAVRRHGNQIPPYRETRDYVAAVNRRRERYAGIPDQNGQSEPTLRPGIDFNRATGEIPSYDTPAFEPDAYAGIDRTGGAWVHDLMAEAEDRGVDLDSVAAWADQLGGELSYADLGTEIQRRIDEANYANRQALQRQNDDLHGGDSRPDRAGAGITQEPPLGETPVPQPQVAPGGRPAAQGAVAPVPPQVGLPAQSGGSPPVAIPQAPTTPTSGEGAAARRGAQGTTAPEFIEAPLLGGGTVRVRRAELDNVGRKTLRTYGADNAPGGRIARSRLATPGGAAQHSAPAPDRVPAPILEQERVPMQEAFTQEAPQAAEKSPPTHTDSTGAPLWATPAPGLYLDQGGNEVEDQYAVPVETRAQPARAEGKDAAIGQPGVSASPQDGAPTRNLSESRVPEPAESAQVGGGDAPNSQMTRIYPSKSAAMAAERVAERRWKNGGADAGVYSSVVNVAPSNPTRALDGEWTVTAPKRWLEQESQPEQNKRPKSHRGAPGTAKRADDQTGTLSEGAAPTRSGASAILKEEGVTSDERDHTEPQRAHERPETGAARAGGEREDRGDRVGDRITERAGDDRALASEPAADGETAGAAGDTGGVRAPDQDASVRGDESLRGGRDGLAGQPGAGEPGLATGRPGKRGGGGRGRRGGPTDAAREGGEPRGAADGETGGATDQADAAEVQGDVTVGAGVQADILAARAENFHADDPERIYGGTPKVRFGKNRRAIEIYRDLEESGRAPTPEEREALAGYTGWGSFGQELFQGSWDRPIYKDGWREENDWLRSHLGESEWRSAADSIINAHYTDPPTVQAMWAMVERLGFAGGRVLEPSAGIGNFFAMMPKTLKDRSRLTAIELDTLSAGMLRLLYPQANVQHKGYQDSQTQDGFYDMVIGNWPFASTGPADRRYNKLSPSLHDYFFLKALDQVRPGGLVVGITSRYTMDSVSRAVRMALAEKAELVAAFRLPSGAFEQYAGTKVVTDIVILKRRETDLTDARGEPWVEAPPMELGDSKDEAPINRYYHDNPERVLGALGWGHGTTYGRSGVIVTRPADLRERLDQMAEQLPVGVYQPAQQVRHIRYVANNTQERTRAVTIGADGGLYQVQGDQLANLQDVVRYQVKDARVTAKREAQLRALVGMRRSYGALIDAERDGAENTEALRAALRGQYQAFVKEHGPLRKSYGIGVLKEIEDPFYPSLAALERESDGRYEPMAVLERPVLRRAKKLENPSVREAYVLERNNGMALRIDAIAEASGVGHEEAERELVESGAVFRLPDGQFEPADVYLSGNVRRKLREAREAAEQGEDMVRNIKALEDALPPTVPYFNIEARLGAQWVGQHWYRQFVAEELIGDPNAVQRLELEWRVNRWVVIPDDGDVSTQTAMRWRQVNAYKTLPDGQVVLVDDEEISLRKLVEAAFNNGTMRFTGKNEDGTVYVREALNAAANERATAIREAFEDWVWRDPERKMALERDYNEVMNAIAFPSFDGSFLSFEGMALQLGENPFNLRKHQVNAIWRALVQGSGLYAHEVGTGKTYTIAGIAVESRRFGLARKPLILAHNANSAAVAAEIQEMYPGAKVLYVNNLEPKRVKETLHQIRNDDWDAVVMPHSLLDRLALSRESLEALAAKEIAALEQAFYDAMAEDAGGGNPRYFDFDNEDDVARLRNPTAKELAKQRLKIKQRIEKMAQAASREDAVTFENLGVDMLLVDEAHLFKKPVLATRMKMRGLNLASSNRAIALKFLTDYIKDQNGGRGVHLFTGTPITNTLSEIFHMQRYVMQGDMERDGISGWDSWFNTFATGVSDVELTAAGEYEPITRLAGFINVAELRRMMSTHMDVVFADEMPEFSPRKTKSGKTLADSLSDAERDELRNGRQESPVGRPYKKVVMDVAEMSPEQQAILAHLQQLAMEWKEASKKQKRDWMREGDPHSPLLIDGTAARAGMDARMEDPSLPEHQDSKVNRAVRNILRHYRDEPQSTQVVFMDKGYSDTRTVRGGRVEGHNLAKELVAKLQAAGVPADEIATVAGGVSPEKKAAIADAVNAGKIRVVIGQTETLGTGVNMQRRLRAMHHLDAPWMPGELEQRNGRGWRQGNTWNTVLEYRYVTERIDGKRWQVLSVKDRFIKAFLQADETTRVIEGDAASDEANDSLAATLAEAAGDPRLLVRTKLRQDVDRLLRKERVHVQGVAEAREQLKRQQREGPKLKALATNLRADYGAFLDARETAQAAQRSAHREAVRAYVQGLGLKLGAAQLDSVRDHGWGPNQPDRDLAKRVQQAVKQAEDRGNVRPDEPTTVAVDAMLNGTHYTSYKAFDEALSEFASRRQNRFDDWRDVGALYGFTLQAVTLRNGQLAYRLASRHDPGQFFEPYRSNAQALVGELRALTNRAEAATRNLEQFGQDRANLERVAEAPFARQKDLDRKRQRLEELELDMERNPVPAPAWLRHGAPLDSAAVVDGGPVVVEGHQWAEDGYFVLVVDAAGQSRRVPYLDITGQDGAPLFDAMSFRAPLKVGKPQAGIYLVTNPEGKAEEAPRFLTDEVIEGLLAHGYRIEPAGAQGGEPLIGGPVEAGPLMSLGATKDTARVMPLAEVERRTAELAERSGLAARGVMVQVVSSEAHLPRAIRREILAQNAQGQIEGVMYGGRLYLVADRMGSAADVERVMAHETAHVGMRLLYGPQGTRALRRLYAAVGGEAGIRALGERHGFDMESYFDAARARFPTDPVGRQVLLADELMAHLGQKGPQSLPERIVMALQEFIGAVRAWLRERGFAELAKYNDADLAHELRRIYDAVKAQPKAAKTEAGKGMRFMVAPAERGVGLEAQPTQDARMRDLLKQYANVAGAPSAAELAEAVRQYRDVERANAEVLRAHDEAGKVLPAPNGQPSNLNREQWVLVRTPNFRRWFGEWELAAQRLRSAANFEQARQAAAAFQGSDLRNQLSGLVGTVSRNSLDKMLSASAVRKSESPAEHALAVANLDHLFRDAVPGWSKTDRDADPNVAGIHRLFAPMRVGNEARLVKITLKETVIPGQRNSVYSVEAIRVEKTNPVPEMVDADRAQGSRLLTGPTGFINSLVQRIAEFNANAVSKVVDDNGEPLVVYHGTYSDITNFARSVDGGFHFGTREQARDRSGLFSGGNILPVFLQAKSLVRSRDLDFEVDAGWSARIDKARNTSHDGMVYLNRTEGVDLDSLRRMDKAGEDPNSTDDRLFKQYAPEAQDSYIVFSAAQIKSAIGNAGTYSERPDIRFSRRSRANGEAPARGGYSIQGLEEALAGKREQAQAQVREAERTGRAPGENLGAAPRRDAVAGVAEAPHRAEGGAPTGGARQRLADWLTGALNDEKGGGVLAGLTLRQLADVGERHLPQIKGLVQGMQRFQTARNQMFEDATGRVKEWRQLGRTQAGALAETMHESTLAQWDPSRENGGADPFDAKEAKRRIRQINRMEADMPGERGERWDRWRAERDDLRAKLRLAAYRERHRAPIEALWSGLSPEAQRLYQAVRDDYLRLSERMEEAIVARIEAAELAEEVRKQAILQVRQEFEQARLQGPYFPLQRFGRFYAVLSRPTGKTYQDPKTGETRAEQERAFLLFESPAARRRDLAEARAEGWEVVKQGVNAAQTGGMEAVSEGFVADAVARFREKLGAYEGDKAAEVLYQSFLATMPYLSHRLHFITRRKTAGYSEDALRAYAFNSAHLANQVARQEQLPLWEGALRDAERHVKEVQATAEAGDATWSESFLNEARARFDWLMNPRGSAWASMASALGFGWYLGLTPAAALVNLTQTPMIALPELGSRYGMGAASNALRRAMGQALGARRNLAKRNDYGAWRLTEEERALLRWGHDAGLINTTQVGMLMGMAETESTRYNPHWTRAMEIIGALFQEAEVINRQATLLAAYRLERARNPTGSIEEARERAADLTWSSHFDYSNANRARVMQGDAARVLLQFKNYSQHLTYYLARSLWQATKDETPEVRAEARKRLGAVLGMTTLLAGTAGLPFALKWAVMGTYALASLLFGGGDDGDEPWDTETEWRSFLAQFGWAGKALDRGLGNATLGIDLSSRVGMGQLWLRDPDRDLNGKDTWHHYLEQLLGPVVGIGASAFKAADLMAEGHIERGAEAMLPKAAKDLLRAGRYAAEGVTTTKGDEVVPREAVGPWEVAMQAMGFTPDEIRRQWDTNAMRKDYERYKIDRRRALIGAFALARAEDDDEAMDRARDAIRAFNDHRAAGEKPIAPDDLRESIRTRARYRSQSQGGVYIQPQYRPSLERIGAP